MSGDYSRWPKVPRHDYDHVLLQQGRVLTDADWNEEVLLDDRTNRIETLDSLGRSVVPTSTPDAFEVQLVAGPDLEIGIGRAYLDGLLVENHGNPHRFDPVLVELVDAGSITYSAQPWFASPPTLPAAGPYAVYLKAWERERTAVEEPALIEQALGIDTAARLQTVWQVKVAAAGPNDDCSTPLTSLPAFTSAEPQAAGRLTTALAEVPGQPDPCRTVPGAAYSGLENQLYRVEIHDGGTVGGAGGATFKWSRDNGTVASRVLEINAAGDRIVVDRIGRDEVLAIRDGDWIEITDDGRELSGQPGALRQVVLGAGMDETTRTVRLTQALPAGTFPVDGQGRTLPERNTRVRRWDQSGIVYDEGGTSYIDLDAAGSTGAIPVAAAGTSVLLEEGIVVSFSLDPAAGRFRTGDHWVFAARTADASVEILDHAPPRGVHAHYGKLAFVDAASVVSDCRTLVPPLGEMDVLEYVSGDGQEATPSFVNPAPVHLPIDPTVGVTRGPVRVSGRTVRFSLLDGVGSIGVSNPMDVTTGPDGLASVPWDLDPVLTMQRLRADLLDVGGQAVGVPVIFSARLRTAEEVAYDPSKCGGPAGPANVQDALDLLCSRNGGDRCCRVVRPDEDLAAVIEEEAKRHEGHVCVCLLPGQHRLSNNFISSPVTLEIHGHAAQILADRPIVIDGPQSLLVADVTLVAIDESIPALLEVDKVESTEIARVTARREAQTPESTCVRFDACLTIRIHDCTLANRRFAAIELIEQSDEVWIESNEIDGAVILHALFGDPSPEEVILEQLRGYDQKGEPAPEAPFGRGELRILDNLVERIGLGSDAARAVVSLLDTSDPNAVQNFAFFRAILVNGNTLTRPIDSLVADSVIVSSNTFVGDDGQTLGFVYANAATVVGNVGPGTKAELSVTAGQRDQVGNVRMQVTLHP